MTYAPTACVSWDPHVVLVEVGNFCRTILSCGDIKIPVRNSGSEVLPTTKRRTGVDSQNDTVLSSLRLLLSLSRSTQSLQTNYRNMSF